MTVTETVRDRIVCRECRDGKHTNCFGDAWDMDEDRPAICECWAANHVWRWDEA